MKIKFKEILPQIDISKAPAELTDKDGKYDLSHNVDQGKDYTVTIQASANYFETL